MLLAAMAAGTVLGAGSLWAWFTYGDGPAREHAVEFELAPQLGATEIARKLAELGVVRSARAMALYLRVSGGAACAQPGTHLLPPQASPALLRKLLCRSPDRPTRRVIIPEGFTRFAVAQRLQQQGVVSAKAFVSASADPALLRGLDIEAAAEPWADTAEGYLFPATYQLGLDSKAAAVLRRLVLESHQRWRALVDRHRKGFEELVQRFGWGRREVLTLASMVEKETALAAERPVIASVFINRLADPVFKPKLLQSDPTTAYGCVALPTLIPSCRHFTGRTTGELNRDETNPYSTYAHPGLPPGPVANPGVEAMAAVLAPARTDYLYFVALGRGGRHEFSKDYESHRRAVSRLRDQQH